MQHKPADFFHFWGFLGAVDVGVSTFHVNFVQQCVAARCNTNWSGTDLLASMRSCSAHSLSERCCRSSKMFMVLWKWPHDRLTLTAVSCLSPVSTHTLMPASRRASMVSWTLSWSLRERQIKTIHLVLWFGVLRVQSFYDLFI